MKGIDWLWTDGGIFLNFLDSSTERLFWRSQLRTSKWKQSLMCCCIVAFLLNLAELRLHWKDVFDVLRILWNRSITHYIIFLMVFRGLCIAHCLLRLPKKGTYLSLRFRFLLPSAWINCVGRFCYTSNWDVIALFVATRWSLRAVFFYLRDNNLRCKLLSKTLFKTLGKTLLFCIWYFIAHLCLKNLGFFWLNHLDFYLCS